MRSTIEKRGNRYYFNENGVCRWYMVANRDGEFNVYDDGEYEGKYCGSLEKLYKMSDPLGYVIKGL